jgi:hypothetical protein
MCPAVPLWTPTQNYLLFVFVVRLYPSWYRNVERKPAAMLRLCSAIGFVVCSLVQHRSAGDPMSYLPIFSAVV